MATIRCDPTLVETVVLAEIARRTHAGDQQWDESYHRQTDPLYGTIPITQREGAFDELHARLFVELGFSHTIAATFAEIVELQERAPTLLLLGARVTQDEGAVIGRDGRSICLRILPTRFADPQRMASFIRHELLHAADMLDDTFGYRLAYTGDDYDAHPRTIGAINMRAEGYRALWCTHIDSRLIRRGLIPLADQSAHRRDFDRRFAATPEPLRHTLFQRIWNAEHITHADILAITQQADAAAIGEHPRRTMAPGALCPLCRFPTHRWAPAIDDTIAQNIQNDFPTWQRTDGACARCVEVYALRTCREVQL